MPRLSAVETRMRVTRLQSKLGGELDSDLADILDDLDEADRIIATEGVRVTRLITALWELDTFLHFRVGWGDNECLAPLPNQLPEWRGALKRASEALSPAKGEDKPNG